MLNPSQQEELGFIVTFISKAFQKLLLKDVGVKLEDLVFRKLDTSNNAYEQYESSDEDSLNGDKSKSVLIKDRKKSSTSARKTMYDAWKAKEAVLINLK